MEYDEDAYEDMADMMRYFGYYEPDFTWEDVEEVYNPYKYEIIILVKIKFIICFLK